MRIVDNLGFIYQLPENVRTESLEKVNVRTFLWLLTTTKILSIDEKTEIFRLLKFMKKEQFDNILNVLTDERQSILHTWKYRRN